MLYGLLFVVELCFLVFCVLSVITTPEGEVRHLPKLLWLLLVVVLPVVGGIAWLVAGRPQQARSLPHEGDHGAPGRSRPGRAVAASPDDDEEFLRGLAERAAEQRRRAEQERRRSEGA